MGANFSLSQIFQSGQDTKPLTFEDLPFGNEKLRKLSELFHFSYSEVVQLHHIYRQVDKKGNGYISRENIFDFLEEELTSPLAPFIDRLYQLIDKETQDKISFTEWLPAIAVYCLYTNEQIINFVFQMLDEDCDGLISKTDIIKFILELRNNTRIFPFNYIQAIEQLEVERSDAIDLKLFIKIQFRIPFLCYPAFRFQQMLQEQIMGKKFWQKIYQLIRDKENDDNKILQTEKYKQQLKEEENKKKMEKIKLLENIFKTRKLSQNLLKDIIKVREVGRRGSEGKIGFHEPAFKDFFPDQILKRNRCNSDLYVKKNIWLKDIDRNQQNQQNFANFNINYATAAKYKKYEKIVKERIDKNLRKTQKQEKYLKKRLDDQQQVVEQTQ